MSFGSEEMPEMCAERFGERYIAAFGDTATEHCDDESTGRLTCFSHKADDTRTDSFCMGGLTFADEPPEFFGIDCKLRDLKSTSSLPRFPSYWYNTGPRYIFSNHVGLARKTFTRPQEADSARRFSFLIKREANNQNMWHEMMEIMSLFLSLDVLRKSVDPSTGRPYFTSEDVAASQVIFLDDLEDGPWYDLWSMYAGMPPVRFSDVTEGGEDFSPTQIVVPLPGGSNPFWQGDWVDIPCGESYLLHQFSERVLDFYGVQETAVAESAKLRLTLIDRQQKRRLLDKHSYFNRLQSAHPDIEMQMVDYATMPFAEQLRISRSTNILVGVHGAGLTQGMFLPPKSTIVEILPPGLEHKGFSNMAQRLGHQHLRQHASEPDRDDQTGDWQEDDVFLEEDRFTELMEEAIAGARR